MDGVFSVGFYLASKLLACGPQASKVQDYDLGDQNTPNLQHTFGDAMGGVFSGGF